MAELREAGTIKAFGCGVNAFDDVQHCDEFAPRIAEIADLDFYLIAGGHYTLLDQQALDVQFPVMDARDMSAIIGTPFSSGRLAPPLPGSPIAEWIAAGRSQTAQKVKRLTKLCEETFNVPLGAVALQFPLAHPRVACVIPGGADAAQVKQNQEFVDTAIPKDLWRRLKEEALIRADAPTPGDTDASL